ncbi:MAG: hypothetical protein ABSF60_16045 [Verrucomicrobiota bacterium]
MSDKKTESSPAGGGVLVQVNLIGLIIFSAVLVATAALMTHGLDTTHHEAGDGRTASKIQSQPAPDYSRSVVEPSNVSACGQLITHDIDLEEPDEYVTYDTTAEKGETWTFEGTTPDKVRMLMQSCGLPAVEIERTLSPASMVYNNANTIVRPGDDLVLSLSPGMRSKLYAVLGQYGSNKYMRSPFCFPGNSFETRFDKSKVSDATFSRMRKMLYPRGNVECFSDLQTLLQQVPDENERQQLVKALSRQSALLVGIHISPDSDIDKLVGYWGWPSGVRLMNVRPLLESLKRRPGGGSASILYFLPPFARERLYTYPLPAQLGDQTMDCHWSAMNFFNETPDNNFYDPKYTTAYVLKNYYRIAKPTAYGDLIFLLDKNGDAIHSAVYLAEDIVFTKNGNNSAQPWMLMHLKDLVAEYTTDVAPKIAVYRNKNW